MDFRFLLGLGLLVDGIRDEEVEARVAENMDQIRQVTSLRVRTRLPESYARTSISTQTTIE